MRKHLAKMGLTASVTAAAAAAMTVSASAANGGDAAQSGAFGMTSSIVIMILLFAVMYFILIRPQKKKDKEQKAMQNDLRMGDEVVTIGGIIGIVVKLGEDNVVIECGDRSRIRMKKWAIQENVTVREDAERTRAAMAEAKKAKKEGKKKDEDSGESMLKD